VADITFISLAARRVPVTGARHVAHHVAMAVPTIALPEARDALSRAAGRWADLLRSLPDTRATIPGSRWTVGDAAAHVVMDVRTETLVATGEAVSWAQDATSAPGTPRGAAELNARAVTTESERDPRALANMLVTAVGDFLAASAELAPDHPMPSQYFQGQMALDLAGVTGAELGEVLVHGYDIAKATGRPWPVTADDARLALRAALRLTSAYINPDTAHGHTGGYDLRIRGGPRIVIRFTDGRASLEQPGDAPVDCHILAAPVALLLVLYGRIPQWGPIAKGQLLTWGRRPWRALGFKQLFLNP
jgi:uncharacterized protein (TIGR03083 family)